MTASVPSKYAKGDRRRGQPALMRANAEHREKGSPWQIPTLLGIPSLRRHRDDDAEGWDRLS